ncbi:tail tape measure protein [Sphingomonas sp. Leaf339]|uniref:hypothetical protein n=1 Tax=Sphingomonas sp. Leaf339 TaxID=1736343 RepID=UPI0006F988AF|nr:hypothetical protein [Sphingomonas sp. Leaf339]KQU53093.1 tail tape measure protein [Sphingomonas sp. Leaf339]
MDDEIDRMMIAVRADTTGFARDVAQMRSELGNGLGEGADRAGRLIEGSLLRAVRGGKLGFDELRSVALRALDDIAGAALRGGVQALFGSGGGLGSALAGLLGAPGRATGGPVVAGRPYTVGERGPELFVPTAGGRIEPMATAAGTREVRVAITVNAGTGEASGALMQSSRQVARAVRAALAEG